MLCLIGVLLSKLLVYFKMLRVGLASKELDFS